MAWLSISAFASKSRTARVCARYVVAVGSIRLCTPSRCAAKSLCFCASELSTVGFALRPAGSSASVRLNARNELPLRTSRSRKSPRVTRRAFGNIFGGCPVALPTLWKPLWSTRSHGSLTAKQRRFATGSLRAFSGPGRCPPGLLGHCRELWFFSPQVKHVLSAKSNGGFLQSALEWLPWQLGHFCSRGAPSRGAGRRGALGVRFALWNRPFVVRPLTLAFNTFKS